MAVALLREPRHAGDAERGRVCFGKYLHARLGHAAIADVTIERKPGKVVVTIHTGRPGVVIGKKGTEVDQLRDELSRI